MVDNWLPSPLDLIKNEIKTLIWLKDDPLINQNYGRLSAHAFAKYSFYSQQKKPSHFEFESQIETSIDKRSSKVYLGGQILTSNDGKAYKLLTYYFAVCEETSEGKCLLKKIHFDYADPNLPAYPLHPVFHFQFPGELTPALQSQNYDDNHLAPWLSEPRVPFHPMTLALLLNLILTEFPDTDTKKVIKRPEWRSLIRKNEELVLDPYYNKCSHFIEQRESGQLSGNKYLLTSDFHYGIT